ncbi:DUF5667 domain-containing protein [uncultured Methanoregula sp.]|uniref:DUF5667 domain-containing protein n=1 Tax=uncultured Methanoregula sp. TaxID=1005933 RepID=UPI002AAAB3E9|nr:DUF5667 domain-containing protein [uncultured Methanoregula sp.]
MKTRSIFAFSLVALALISSIGIAAAAPAADVRDTYQGTIGPDHSLYGLKIAFENLDESFTFNESELLEKQVSHANVRLAELKYELAENKTESADRVLDLYRQKINQTETALGQYAPNETGRYSGADNLGLEHALEMIEKHQLVLESLLNAHPDNPGLNRAYNNSLALEQKFENRLERRSETRNGQAPHSADNSTMIRQPNHDFGQNRTLSQDGIHTGDGGRDGNVTRQDPGMNYSMNSDSQGRNKNQGSPQVINQTAGNQQPPGTDKATQNGQGNTHDNTGDSQKGNPGGDNSNRNTGTGNTINPGNNQNENANSAGTNPGTTRNTVNSGSQGGSTDPRMKNR